MATSPEYSSSYVPLPSLIPLVTFKLDEYNYLLWKLQWTCLLRSQNLFSHVDGATTVSGDDSAGPEDPEEWRRRDALLMSCLMATMTEQTCVLAVGLETASEIWNKCEAAFNNLSRYRVLCLRKQLVAMEKSDDVPLDEYLSRFNYVCHSLASIGSPLEDSDKAALLFRGLGRRYETIVTVIMAQSPVPSYDLAVPMILDYDLHLRTTAAEPPNRPAGTGEGARCQICRRRNHTGLDCWYRYDQPAQPLSPRPPSSPAPEIITYELRPIISDLGPSASSGQNHQMGPPEWSSISTEASE